MSDVLKVSVVQSNTGSCPNKNLSFILKKIKAASKENANMIVFPEV